MKYCNRCCMPNSSEGITFDDMGICSGCQSSEDKMNINWAEREKKLKKILLKYQKKSGDNYDCIVTISGAKIAAFNYMYL